MLATASRPKRRQPRQTATRCLIGLGNYSWETEGYWAVPGRFGGALSLFSTAHCEAAKAGQPLGPVVAAFDHNDPDFARHKRDFENSGGMWLTTEDARDARPDGRMRDAFERRVGYRPQGDTLASCLWDTFIHGDPANVDRCAPQIPGDGLELELAAFGGVLCSRTFRWGDVPHYDSIVIDCLRRQLNEHRRQAHAGLLINPRHHLKVAGANCLLFGGNDPLGFFKYLKLGWPADELPLDPSTVVADPFTRADSTGLGAGWSDTNGTASLDVVSNTAKGTTTTVQSRMRYDTDLSSNNNYGQADVTRTVDANCGPCCRYQGAADTMYAWVLRSATNNKRRLFSIAAGTLVEIAGDTTAPPAVTYTAKVSAGMTAASSIRVYLSGAEITALATTNTTVTTGLRAGLLGTGNTSEPSRTINDNFQGGDAAAGRLIGGPLTDSILIGGSLVQ